MKTREWKSILRRASLDAFLLWILEQPDDKTWRREDACACPLHDFIEDVAGVSLCINSPELSEHWHERETQTWPTPWWMTFVMRAVDHCATDMRVTKDELLAVALLMVRRDFSNIPMSPAELAEAA
jgi:hypothetical protein